MIFKISGGIHCSTAPHSGCWLPLREYFRRITP